MTVGNSIFDFPMFAWPGLERTMIFSPVPSERLTFDSAETSIVGWNGRPAQLTAWKGVETFAEPPS